MTFISSVLSTPYSIVGILFLMLSFGLQSHSVLGLRGPVAIRRGYKSRQLSLPFKTKSITVIHPSPHLLFSSSETAADTPAPSNSNPMLTIKQGTTVNGATPKQVTFPSRFQSLLNWNNDWFEKIRSISNFASFLCVLDCTILPLITVALPLLGILNLGSSQLETLHQLGHSLALYFVLPVGSLTTVINYMSHRKKWISTIGTIGLVLVGLANSHIHLHNNPQWITTTLHAIQHCGPWHRVVNISGCAFLLGSNYLSQKQGCAHHDHTSGEQGDSSCSHNHSHKDHDHNH